MVKIRSAFSKIRGLLRGGKPKVPKVPQRRSRETLGGGHRGVAAGSLKPGEQDLSVENVGKWRSLPASEVESFVYEAEPLYFHSTNVKMAQYFIDDEKLMVEFKGGPAYLYSN